MPLDGEPFRGPDAKPTRQPHKQIRTVDKSATGRAVLMWRVCGACGKPSATGHHVLGRGAPHFGDDIEENILPLCGSGTTGCHGLVENEHEPTRRAIGKWLREHRPDTIEYVQTKLGRRAGNDWLRRSFFMGRK